MIDYEQIVGNKTSVLQISIYELQKLVSTFLGGWKLARNMFISYLRSNLRGRNYCFLCMPYQLGFPFIPFTLYSIYIQAAVSFSRFYCNNIHYFCFVLRVKLATFFLNFEVVKPFPVIFMFLPISQNDAFALVCYQKVIISDYCYHTNYQIWKRRN